MHKIIMLRFKNDENSRYIYYSRYLLILKKVKGELYEKKRKFVEI